MATRQPRSSNTQQPNSGQASRSDTASSKTRKGHTAHGQTGIENWEDADAHETLKKKQEHGHKGK